MSTNSGQSSGIETASLSLSRPLKAIGRIPSSSGTFLVAGNKLGSLQCLSGFPAHRSLVDPIQLMTLQDGAHTHKISSEVMRRSLHMSVGTPSRRRYNRTRKVSMSLYSGKGPMRFFQSLPVTPALQSPSTSPTRSPLLYHCNNSSPYNERQLGGRPCEEGLVSLFKPQPRYLAACLGSRTSLCGQEDEQVF